MKRRTYLALTLPLVAGCSEMSSGSGPDDVTGVTVEPSDLEADAPDVTLAVAYNARTSTELSPGGGTTLAEDGNKWVIVRMDVTNTGDTDRDLMAHQYVLETGSEAYEIVAFDDHYLRDQTAPAGGTATGWIAFHVPTDTESATLTADQEALAEQLAVTFTHDDSLDAAFPDG